MKAIFIFIMSLVSSFVVAQGYGHSNTLDEKSCWDAKDYRGVKCLVQRDHRWQGTTLYVNYSNNCSNRIYVKVCHAKKTGSKDCGAFGVGGSGTYKYYTYEASGDIAYAAVGSDKSSNDWVCSDRYGLQSQVR